MKTTDRINLDDKERGFKQPFPYGVICKIHGLQEISENEYEIQKGKYYGDNEWKCPVCGKIARLDLQNTWGQPILGFDVKVELNVTHSKFLKKWKNVEKFCEAMEAKLAEVNKIADGKIWTTVDIVYETRWDCPMMRLAAAH